MATIRLNANQLISTLQSAENRARIQIRMQAHESAKVFENYAKINKPWRNRTGHARQRLTGYVEEHGNKIRVCVAHGVDYGRSLEYEHERKYAILEPTVKANSAKALAGMKVLLKRVFGNV